MKLCPKCNVEVADNAKFCSTCGYAFPETAAPADPVAAPAAAPAPVAAEPKPEETFDYKPLVTDWVQTNGFAKFLFNVWPKLNGIGTLISILLTIGGVFFGGLGLMTNIPVSPNPILDLIPDFIDIETIPYTALSMVSTGIGLRLFLLVINMFFQNELKKWLFAGYLRKKEIDLDMATKYVFYHISHDNFSSVPKKEKGNMVAWLSSPQYFGEAVMMAADATSKKSNIIWTSVWAAVNFVSQSIQNSVLLLFVGSFFSLNFADIDTVAPMGGYILLYLVVSIAFSIACAIINAIYIKKKSEIKAVWAITASNPDATNVISA